MWLSVMLQSDVLGLAVTVRYVTVVCIGVD